MKLIVLLIFFFVLLTGCPPRPAYIALEKYEVEKKEMGIKIRAIDFSFLNLKKDSSSCDIVFKLTNDNNIRSAFKFSGTSLYGSSSKFSLFELRSLSRNPEIMPIKLPVESSIVISPKSDTLLIFSFMVQKSSLPDTIHMNMVLNLSQSETFNFRKSNKHDKRIPF